MELTIVQKIAIWALPLLFAISLHEAAHGWIASLFGDQTARLLGRLTINPLKHIDPVGTVVVPLLMLLVSNFIFGWAKPVPIDERQLKSPRRDMALVALAGPMANLLMALFWGGIAKIGMLVMHAGNGSIGLPLAYMGEAGIMINGVLAVLNLIPLPPLDGGRILTSFLPARMAYQFSLIEPYGFFILILLLVTGVLSYIMMPLVSLLMNSIHFLYQL